MSLTSYGNPGLGADSEVTHGQTSEQCARTAMLGVRNRGLQESVEEEKGSA